MKKIIVIFLLAVSSIGHSQDTTAAKLTAREVYNDFKNVIASLEGPAKHTYQVMVAKEKTEGVVDLIASTSTALIFFILFFVGLRVGRKVGWDEEWPIPVCIIAAIGFLISIGIFFTNLSTNINQITNPEYYAIKTLLETIK